ncbi:hypothetical protein Scep_018959 [Stephania cephalantha]|uniref:non-specific serine/threonine protein kinase n=1 Tax=Stephania cephalantha TaxID=152367 RepID=A0AAP0IA15_9MAGN
MVLVPRHHITTHHLLQFMYSQLSMVPPGYVYPHEHCIKPSSSHQATSSPSAHPAHSPGVGDEHISTSRRPPAPHRTSSARSSTNRLCSSIPIPDFFRPPTALTEGENHLIHLIAEHGLLHPSSVAAGNMSLVFKSGYLKEGWKWEYVPQSQRDIYWLRRKVFFTWDLQMSFAIYDAWCRKAVIRYTSNIYLIAEKRITHIYSTEEVFEHYKGKRATDETFKKKSEQMSTNRKSEVGGSGTGISLHSAGSISARQHGDTLEKKQRRPTRKEIFRDLHTHGHDGQTFIDQRSANIDAVALRRHLPEIGASEALSCRRCSPHPKPSLAPRVYPELVKESLELVMREISVMKSLKRHPNVVSLLAHTILDMGRTKEAFLVMELCEKSLVNVLQRRGAGYFEEKQVLTIFRDVCNAVFAMHRRCARNIAEGANGTTRTKQRDKMERQEENRELQDRLARMEALLMQHLGIRPHVPLTPRPPLSPVIERSGPQSDQPGHLTTDRAPSQSAHLDDHQPRHWTDPHREMLEDIHHLLDDHDEFMSQLMPPPRPPPRQ